MANKVKQDLFDPNSLLEELQRMRQTLFQILGSENQAPSGNKDAVVFRFCKNIPSLELNKAINSQGLQEWQVLPLQGDLYQQIQTTQEKLDQFAFKLDKDPLTGLFNRNSLDRHLDQELEKAYRYSYTISLAMLDLDDFKMVNDQYGHLAGDEVLKSFAQVLRENMRKSDQAYRYGGEEFVLLLPGTGLLKAEKMFKRLLSNLKEKKFFLKEHGISLNASCSIGVVCYKGKLELSAQKILSQADETMYKAKKQGKGQVVVGPILGLPKKEKEMQVRQQEKQFLFSGWEDE